MSIESFKFRYEELIKSLTSLVENQSLNIHNIALEINKASNSGNKILLCGNGGSASDCQHFATELMSSFSKKVKRQAIAAIALTTDSTFLTAYSNDFDFETVFVRQIEGLGRKGDVLIIFSTSGSSKNCISAAKFAKENGIIVIVFTRRGAEIIKYSDFSVQVDSENTQHIQECHLFAYHFISELVENEILLKS